MALENHKDYLPNITHSLLVFISIAAASNLLAIPFAQELQHSALALCKIQDSAEVAALVKKLEEFYWRFDSWHCGFNQLKRFKSLSFPLH